MLDYPKSRDDYVFIDEEQVTDGHGHNFNKYDFKDRCNILEIYANRHSINFDIAHEFYFNIKFVTEFCRDVK